MPPSSSDLCTISGYLYDVQCQPLKGYKIVIRYINQPFVSGNDTIFANQYQAIYSNTAGFVTFSLFKGAKVKIEINDLLLSVERICTVPATATADLVSVVYPTLAS